MAKQERYPYQPDFVLPPGDTILELLEERGMTQYQLAQRMGQSIKTINEVIHGKMLLTAEIAWQLEKALGTPARLWLKLEHYYREHLDRRAADKTLQAQQGWLSHFPINSMQAWGWLPTDVNGTGLLVALLQFFGIAEPASWEDTWSSCLVNYRKTNAYESCDYALSVWLRQGEIQAQDIQCATYNETRFKELLKDEIRALTCQSPKLFQSQLVALCASVGVAVVFVPQIEGARVSGATRWLTKDKALIQLSLRYKINDHFWFTFFHEAGHIVCHGKQEVFIDTRSEGSDAKEDEANQFAADMLIPPQKYAAFMRSNSRMSKAVVRQFAQEIGIAPGIVVGRLQHDGYLPYSHLNGLKEKFEWEPC
jgi:addiction module HigA family antidote